MRTGIFGGTFDPVHLGHLILAETVRSAENLDRIVFLPAYLPPHKLKQPLSGADHRLTMLRLAIENYPELEISGIEIQHSDVSYTIDTLNALQQSSEFEQDNLFLIIGGDSLADLHTWKEPHRIVGRYPVLCVSRPGVSTEHVHPDIRSKIKMIDAPLISISSTEIRRRVRSGRSIRFWVPAAVESYICERGLYL